MSTPRICRRRGGFTLVEVLATMVLIGIVLPVALRAVSTSLAQASHARYTTQAAQLAETRLSELVVTGDWLSGGSNGDFPEAGPAFKWSSAVQAESGDVAVSVVSVTVTWMERGEEHHLTVSTLAYDAEAGGSP